MNAKDENEQGKNKCKWHGAKETATYLGVTLRCLYLLVHRNRIPAGKIGHKLVFDWDEIDKRIKQCGNYDKVR